MRGVARAFTMENAMQLFPLSLESVRHVAHHLRDQDWREIRATRPFHSPDRIAHDVTRFSLIGRVAATDDGRPAAAIGAAPIFPGVLAVWMFATDDWPRVAVALTRWVRRQMMPDLLRLGHRAECRSLASHVVAHRWLESFGFVREAVLKDFGAHLETFHLYAWRLSDHQHVGEVGAPMREQHALEPSGSSVPDRQQYQPRSA